MTTTMASARRAIGYDMMMAADDEDSEVDGDGVTDDVDGNGATGDEVDDDGDGTMGDNDADDDGDGTTGYDAPDPPTAKAAPKMLPQFIPPNIYLFLCMPLRGRFQGKCLTFALKSPQKCPKFCPAQKMRNTGGCRSSTCSCPSLQHHSKYRQKKQLGDV